MEWNKEDRDRLFSVVSNDRTSDNPHKWKHRKCHLNIRKTFFYFNCEGNQALAQVTQRGGRVSTLRYIQKLSETGLYSPI